MPTTKTEQFVVKSYKLWAKQESDKIRRSIELVSVDFPPHKFFFKVTLSSVAKNFFGKNGIGWISNYKAPNFDPIEMTAWIDPAVFDSFYAVLSSEAPVTFVFEYVIDPAKPNATETYVWSIGLKTDTETPGDFEGGLKTKFAQIIGTGPIP